MTTILDRMYECENSLFLDKGRNPKVGLDCAGLVIYCLKDLIEIKYDFKHYNINNQHFELMTVIDEYFYPIQEKEARVGDMISFKFDQKIKHIALIKEIENDIITIIHSSQKDNKIIVHHLNKFLKRSIHNFHRLKILKEKSE